MSAKMTKDVMNVDMLTKMLGITVSFAAPDYQSRFYNDSKILRF
jgi:hypothetical protein